MLPRTRDGFALDMLPVIQMALAACFTAQLAVAQDDRLDRPFPQEMYIVHITETGTADGPRARDDYMLYPVMPQNGVLVTPDGSGGTFSNKAETIAGPYGTLRQVCEAVKGWGPRASVFGCPQNAPAPQASPNVPDSRSSGRGDWSIAWWTKWWKSLSTGAKLFLGIGFVAFVFSVFSALAGAGTAPRTFNAAKRKVSDRGSPPDAFLNELVNWGRSAPDSLFAKNAVSDIYSKVSSELGPYPDITYRKAVMLEALRVLAGFESSWDWNCGADTSNPKSNTPTTKEAGAFQVSANTLDLDPSLRNFLQATAGKADNTTFINTMKSNHQFAIGFAARLLRINVTHNGPVRDDIINPYLSKEAVLEFQKFLR